MMSCQVSTSRSRKYVGAQRTTSRTQNVKKTARLAIFEDRPAKTSKGPSRSDTSLGMSTGRLRSLVMSSFCPGTSAGPFRRSNTRGRRLYPGGRAELGQDAVAIEPDRLASHPAFAEFPQREAPDVDAAAVAGNARENARNRAGPQLFERAEVVAEVAAHGLRRLRARVPCEVGVELAGGGAAVDGATRRADDILFDVVGAHRHARRRVAGAFGCEPRLDDAVHGYGRQLGVPTRASASAAAYAAASARSSGPPGPENDDPCIRASVVG